MPHERAPLPSPAEVREGLWMLPIPLPVTTLGYTLVYALAAEDGLVLVDAGWATDEAFDALGHGLRGIGRDVGEVVGVLATHVHPDHYGLAGHVREASGAWVGLHPIEADLLDLWYGGEQELVLDRATLAANGVDGDELDAVAGASFAFADYGPPHAPDRLIEGGEVLQVGGRAVVALWTPGHSPGHLAYHLPDDGILLSGDQVLPTMTPGVSYHPALGEDPLGDFLRSLDTVELDGVELVLPAHERPFDDLGARLAALRAHHGSRLSQVAAAAGTGAGTAWAIAKRVSWAKPWPQLRWIFRRAALQETLAHLHALEARDLVERTDDVPHRWIARPGELDPSFDGPDTCLESGAHA